MKEISSPMKKFQDPDGSMKPFPSTVLYSPFKAKKVTKIISIDSDETKKRRQVVLNHAED